MTDERDLREGMQKVQAYLGSLTQRPAACFEELERATQL